MAGIRRRSLALALLFSFVFSAGVIAVPSFSDQDIDNGYVNPKDQVVVQKIKIVDGSSTISTVWIRNLGEADGTDIIRIVIDNDDDPFTSPIKEHTSLANLRTGITFSLGYTVPSGISYLWIGVEIAGADKVSGGERIELRVQFYSGSYTSGYITDGSPERIFKGGFEEKADSSPSAGYLNPGDSNVSVQESTFTDNDGNNSPITITKISVRNMENADDTDVSNVKVEIKVDSTSVYTATKAPLATDWGSGTWLVFDTTNGGTQTAPTVADNATITVEVKVGVETNPADKHKIRTNIELETKENGEVYEQAIEASTTHTIRVQGFEATSDVSADIPSGVLGPEEKLVQKVTFTDDDVNSAGLTITEIWIENDGDATKDDLDKIVIKNAATGTTLRTINNVIDFKQGHRYTGLNIPVANDHSITLAIEYVIDATITDGHTLQPKVYVKAEEPDGGTAYDSDKATYPKSIVLHPHGLESVINVAMTGGTAYSGQRLLAQKVKCEDLDENNDSVRINPVRVKNIATSPCAESEVTKIEVRTEGGALLGEVTDLTGLNAGGVAISTLQNNVVADNSEVTLCIYVTFAGPEVVTAGHKLKLETTIFSEEDGHVGENPATGAEWTLAINHRPVVDFAFEKVTTASALRSTGAPIRPMEFTYEDTIRFTSTVTDPDGAIDEPFTYLWNFGDGKTSTTQNPTHQYPNGGTFQVTLTVTDARGVAGSKTKTFSVEPPPVVPVAGFTWTPTTPGVGDEVTFNDTSTTPTGTTITDRSWDFDGDGTEDSDAENPTHTYTAPGTYEVSLTVTNSDAQTDTVTHEVAVSAAKPTANFDYSPTAPDVRDEISFEDKSSAVDPATIETWAWDFGDDSTSTDQNPTHAYTAMGTYTVSLTVTDSNEETSNAHTEEIVVGPATMVYSYPNPASDAVTIVYRLPEGATNPVLRIFDLAGRLVRQEDLDPAQTTYSWDLTSDGGATLPNGLYFCRITVKDATGKTRNSQIFKLLIDR